MSPCVAPVRLALDSQNFKSGTSGTGYIGRSAENWTGHGKRKAGRVASSARAPSGLLRQQRL
ncbi:MAG: hypothetical protein VW989_02695, partial [Rhodobiaceae bacterium]